MNLKRNIVIVVLVLAIAGVSYWAYDYSKENNKLKVQVENNYQRAFNDLSEDFTDINDKIGTTLAMNSRKSISPALADVWRVTGRAQSSLGQLPIGQLPFSKTEAFLTDIGEFAYNVSVRDLDKTPLTTEEHQTLENLYQRSAEILTEIQKVQTQVFDNGLRWSEVETMLVKNQKGPMDNQIVDGFKTIEKDVAGYDVKSDFGADFSTAEMRTKAFKNVSGEMISKDQAIDKAKFYTNVSDPKDIDVRSNLKGSNYGFYTVSFTEPKSNTVYSIDLTKKGGHPIYFINNRDVLDQKISLDEAVQRSASLLEQKGLTNLQVTESAQYGSIALFTFTRIENGIRVYPDQIKLKVALDNNTIIALTADEYFENGKTRENLTPELSETDARSKISPSVEIMEHHVAVIRNRLRQEVLCHEFWGTVNRDTFRIFINATTGEEELVEKVKTETKL